MQIVKSLLCLPLVLVCALNSYSQILTIPVVTIHATDSLASWSGDTGTFTVFRDGPTNQTLNVFYLIGGTASNGVDYASIGNWVMIPAGIRSNTITIKPINNGQTNIETVVLKLSASPLAIPQNYMIGSPASATVYITPGTLVNGFFGIHAPTNGAIFDTPADIEIVAWAGAEPAIGPGVGSVEFFADKTSLGVVSNSVGVPDGIPGTIAFSLTWSNAPVGGHVLTAVGRVEKALSITSAPVNIAVQQGPPPTNQPPVVLITQPANGDVFFTPTNISLIALGGDHDGYVTRVEFFAGDKSLGVVSNFVILDPPFPVGILPGTRGFFLTWSNPVPGNYVLTAKATDDGGASTVSGPVNIAVHQGPPPTNTPPVVKITLPANGATFFTPVDVPICASAYDLDGYVATVEFFAGAQSLGVKTNNPASAGPMNPFCLVWSNVAPGSYALTAVATDNGGASTVSEPVKILVSQGPPPPLTNYPPVVRIASPPNGALFRAPVNVPLYAYANDRDGFVTSVEFFAGTKSLGLGRGLCLEMQPLGGWPPFKCPTNLFVLIWSNAPPGAYVLTAVATDNGGASATSGPVNITILSSPPPPTNRPPIVTLVASDPLAIEGTNCWPWLGLADAAPTWSGWIGPTSVWRFFTNCGPKNATFTVHRSGDTNDDLTVAYEIGGTATNGVDYVPLSGSVTIPAGQRHAEVTVVPLDDGPPDISTTVVLGLKNDTNYLVGYPRKAAALILDGLRLHPFSGLLSDRSFHLGAPGPDGTWFHVEFSTDLLNWTSICTNQVVNGSIDFIDPDAQSDQSRFYRTVPEANPPPE